MSGGDECFVAWFCLCGEEELELDTIPIVPFGSMAARGDE
jgi:hypothetical protein